MRWSRPRRARGGGGHRDGVCGGGGGKFFGGACGVRWSPAECGMRRLGVGGGRRSGGHEVRRPAPICGSIPQTECPPQPRGGGGGGGDRVARPRRARGGMKNSSAPAGGASGAWGFFDVNIGRTGVGRRKRSRCPAGSIFSEAQQACPHPLSRPATVKKKGQKRMGAISPGTASSRKEFPLHNICKMNSVMMGPRRHLASSPGYCQGETSPVLPNDIEEISVL